MPNLKYINRSERKLSGTLTATLNTSALSIAVSSPPSSSKLPSYIVFEPGISSEELCEVIAVSGSTITLRSRGLNNGGTGIQHLGSTPYEFIMASRHWEELADAVEDGWMSEDASRVLTRISATQFKVTGYGSGDDLTAYYHVGKTVRFNGSDSSIDIITATSYSAGPNETTVTVATSSVPNPLTSVSLGVQPRGLNIASLTETLTNKTLTTPKVGTSINDTGGNEIIRTPATASAVNDLTVTNAATGNGPTISASGDDTNIDLNLNSKGTGQVKVNGVPISSSNGGTNLLTNSNFDVFQRVSFASRTSSGYALDRWYATLSGTVTITQQTTGAPVGSTNVMRVAYNAASSSASMSQALENIDVKKLWGKNITASVKLRRNASFAANITVALSKNSTGDTATGGTWSNIQVTTISNASLPTGTTSTDWVTATVTATIPSDGSANGLRLLIAESAGGASGDYYEVSQAQICAGDVALSFVPKSFEDELRACMRYYEKSYDYTVAPGTSSIGGYVFVPSSASTIANSAPYAYVPFKVKKRSTPTNTIYGFSGGSGKSSNATSGADFAANSATNYSSSNSEFGVAVCNTSGGALTVGGGGFIYHFVAEAEL